MEQETPKEFISGQAHRLHLAAISIILPLNGNLIVFNIEKAVVGDSHAVSVSAYVVEDLLGSGEWALGKDCPLALLQFFEVSGKGQVFAKYFQAPEKLQFSGIEYLLQGFEE